MYKKLVTDYLDDVALRFPDKIGFEDEEKALSFSQFRKNACALATEILRKGYVKSPVAVYLDKSVNCLVGTLVLFIAPISSTILGSTQMPSARVRKICDVLEPVLVIT